VKAKKLLAHFLEYFNLTREEAEHVFHCFSCELSGLEGAQEFCREFMVEFRGWTPPVLTEDDKLFSRALQNLWAPYILDQMPVLKFEKFQAKENQ